MKPPVCRNCGAKVMYGNLFCTPRCEDAFISKREATVKQLEAEGFERDDVAFNIFRKDGAAVTLEHIEHVGLETAIQHHGFATKARRA